MMSAPAYALLLSAALHGEGFGIEDGHATSAADGAALVMLGVIFFVVGLLAVFAWTMRRRSRRPDATLEFLTGLKEETTGASPEANVLEKWERPADWWKQE